VIARAEIEINKVCEQYVWGLIRLRTAGNRSEANANDGICQLRKSIEHASWWQIDLSILLAGRASKILPPTDGDVASAFNGALWARRRLDSIGEIKPLIGGRRISRMGIVPVGPTPSLRQLKV